MSIEVERGALPQVITQLFKPFGPTKRVSIPGSPIEDYVAAFNALMGNDERNATQTYSKGATSVEVNRRAPYVDNNVDLGWGAGMVGTEKFGVGRFVEFSGSVAVAGLKPKVEAFLSISTQDSSLEGASWSTDSSVWYGFQLPETVAAALFSRPDKSFDKGSKHALGRKATGQAFGLSIKALNALNKPVKA